VYDLGCGDGRLLLLLAEEVRCRGVGVDIDCDLIQQAQAEAAARHLSDLLDFATEDMLVTAEDLARASVLMLYLVPQALQALLPLFRKEWSRRPDLRVVTFVYPIAELEPQTCDSNWKLFLYNGNSVHSCGQGLSQGSYR